MEIFSCTSARFEELLEMCNLVLHKQRGIEGNLGEEYPHFFARENFHNLRYIEKEGLIVSHVGSFICYLKTSFGKIKAGLVGGVATLPAHRGRGYATELMRDALRIQREQGVAVSILWSGSPDFYRRIGYELVGSHFAIGISQSELSFTKCFKRIGLERRMNEIQEMINHDSLPRVIRSIQNTERRLNQKSYITYGFFRENRLKGFLMTQASKDTVHITDWMGPEKFYPEAVAFLLKNHKSVGVNCPHGHPFLQKIKGISNGLEITEAEVGMFRVIDFKNMACILERSGERLEVSDEELSSETHRRIAVEIFGRPGKESQSASGLPVRVFIPLADHV